MRKKRMLCSALIALVAVLAPDPATGQECPQILQGVVAQGKPKFERSSGETVLMVGDVGLIVKENLEHLRKKLAPHSQVQLVLATGAAPSALVFFEGELAVVRNEELKLSDAYSYLALIEPRGVNDEWYIKIRAIIITQNGCVQLLSLLHLNKTVHLSIVLPPSTR